MQWRSDFVAVLKNDFEARKKKNPRFSQRAYAKKIGLSSSSLSNLLSANGKWKLSVSRAAAIVKDIPLTNSVRNKLLVKMGEQPRVQKHTLKPPQLKVLSQWYYVPVLIYMDLPPVFRKTKHIAHKLDLKEAKVKEIIKELIEFGMLEKNKNGDVQRREAYTSTSDGITNKIIQKFSEMNLRLFLKMQKRQQTAERDSTSLTFVGSKAKIDLLKAETRRLYEKVALMDDGDQNDAVFRLSVQLSPVEFITDGKKLKG